MSASNRFIDYLYCNIYSDVHLLLTLSTVVKKANNNSDTTLNRIMNSVFVKANQL
jgi:hypothetical protein